MTKDKERDDALIAEKKRLAEQLQIFAYGLGSSPSASMMLQAAAILRGDEQPKPDRAEVLFDDLYGKTKDEQIDCFRRHFAELRAEWEAERPAVVVPREAKLWADSVGYCSATRYEERTTAKWIKSLDGAKGGE